MKPTAVACHRGIHGRRRPSTSRRMTRQRIVRSGNVRVARVTPPRKGHSAARRMWPSTAPGSTSRSVQYRSAIVTRSPPPPPPPPPPAAPGPPGGGNENADLFREGGGGAGGGPPPPLPPPPPPPPRPPGREGTRLNPTHPNNTYAVLSF